MGKTIEQIRTGKTRNVVWAIEARDPDLDPVRWSPSRPAASGNAAHWGL